MATPADSLVCMLDCDNTLIDNDAIKASLDTKIEALLGPERAARFWSFYESTRQMESTVDYPTVVHILRPELGDALADQLWETIWRYPFAETLYPYALDVIAHLDRLGVMPTVVSDGDSVYQPEKIRQSGIAAAVKGNVQVYIHKQQHISEILTLWPAAHYAMVDDKAPLLAAFKRMMPERFTTIHVNQGHYASQPGIPAPDRTVERIGDLLNFTRADLLGA